MAPDETSLNYTKYFYIIWSTCYFDDYFVTFRYQFIPMTVETVDKNVCNTNDSAVLNELAQLDQENLKVMDAKVPFPLHQQIAHLIKNSCL